MREYVFKEEFLEENKQNKQPVLFEQNSRFEACIRFVFILLSVWTAIFLSLVILKFASPETFSKIKGWYRSAVTEEDVSFKDIFGKIQGSGGDDGINNVSQNEYVLTTKISPPTRGVVTSQFGERIHPITQKESFHTGIDIASKLDTPIYCAFNGTVYECGESEAYGNYIIVKHSENLFTFYGHCNKIRAREGMKMRKGEIIAQMGSTGYSTGSHLHFEIRINGIRVDPALVLKGFEEIEF